MTLKLTTVAVALLIGLFVTAAGYGSGQSEAIMTISDVTQDSLIGTVEFNVTASRHDYDFRNNGVCDGVVAFSDGSDANIETGLNEDYQATPDWYDYGNPPPTPVKISVNCDWSYTVTKPVRYVATEWKWRNASGYFKRYGTAKVYSYLTGTLTIDNRRSAKPATVYWRIRHPGRALSAMYHWNLLYSTPGWHRAGWYVISVRWVEVYITIAPRMMFTVTDLGVKYRYNYTRYEDFDIPVHAEGTWTP